VPLASLPDGLDPRPFVALLVAGPDALWCAIHHHIHLAQEILQGTLDRDASPLHTVSHFRQGSEDRIAALDGHPNSIVLGDIRYTHQLHVVLERHGIGHPLPHHPVPVHTNPDLLALHHAATSGAINGLSRGRGRQHTLCHEPSAQHEEEVRILPFLPLHRSLVSLRRYRGWKARVCVEDKR